MRVMLLPACMLALLTSPAAASITVMDGDFATWTNYSHGDAIGGYQGTATAGRDTGHGNPVAGYAVTTNTSAVVFNGSYPYGDAFAGGIKGDYQTASVLNGLQYILFLDVLPGPGSFGQGQAIRLMVEQNGSVYEGNYLGITWLPPPFATEGFSGFFQSLNFSKISGTGADHPDFLSGVPTRFGFNAANTGSGPSLTMYYDNFHLSIPNATYVAPPPPPTPTPEPASLAMWTSLGLAGLIAARRRNKC